MIELSNAWMTWWMDVMVKSWLLAAVAMLAIAVCRIDNANLKHRIWTAVCVGMLAMPLLVLLTPRAELPSWLTPFNELNSRWELQEVEPIGLGTALRFEQHHATSGSVPPNAHIDAQLEQQVADEPATSGADDPLSSMIFPGDRARGAKGERSIAGAAGSGQLVTSSWLVGCLLVHVVVSTIALLRIAVGLWQLRLLITRSREVDASPWGLPARVRLLEATRIHVPVTVGFFRPCILLPASWRDWPTEKVLSVLTHEAAHIGRGDWLVMLLANLTCALQWFNPLSWLVRRRLDELAEANCDDAVIQSRGDRRGYALHLLEVAMDLSSAGARYRIPPSGVAMARRPSVEMRIDAILDDARPLARRLGAVGGLKLIACAVPLILLAAALGPRNAVGSTKEDAVEDVVSNANPQTDEKPFIYAGRVLLPDGQPAAGAPLRLVYWFYDETQPVRVAPDGVTDSDGRFRFEMRADDFYRTSDSVPPWQWASLAVTAEGFGMTWAPSMAFEESGQALANIDASDPLVAQRLVEVRQRIEKQNRTLRLVEEVPIQGRVINAEGQSVPDVDVSLIEAYTGEDGTLEKWLASKGHPEGDFFATQSALPEHLYGKIARQLIAPVATGADGMFTVRGLGREQLVRLSLQSPSHESAAIYCRTQEGEPFRMAAELGQETTFHARQPVHVAVASRPVTGIVSNAATGEPLAGVVVTSRPSLRSTAPGESTRTGSEFAHAVTDDQGRYTLTGLPNVNGNALRFMPPTTLAILPRFVDANTAGTGMEPLQLDVSLTPGVIVTGRVTDTETGAGVAGYVQYLRDDKRARGVTIVASDPFTVSSGRADYEGRFEMVLPQGSGHVSFQAFDASYQKTADRPEGTVTLFEGLLMGRPSSRVPEFHAIASLELESDMSRQEVAMSVSRGRVITGRVLDDAGKAIESGFFSGYLDHAGWIPFSQSTLSIISLSPLAYRRVTVVSGDYQLSGTLLLSGNAAKSFEIRLQPSATLTGRIVDDRGEAISGARVQGGAVQIMASPNSAAVEGPRVPLTRTPGDRDYFTDQDGRFTIRGLVADVEYELMGQVGSGGRYTVGNLTQGVVAKGGETVDLGELQLELPKPQDAFRLPRASSVSPQ